ncbi:MAG: hypothetical protein ACI8TX_000786 [Hyphomicrobiaceae bacterium]|jgi:hypothetical protein
MFNPSYLGVMGGLAMAFKQAKGESPWIQEGTLAGDLGASAVRLNLVLDFSTLQSSNSKWDRWASSDSAEVSGEVKFAASGAVVILPIEALNDRKMGKFTTKHPLTSPERFYTSPTNGTTTGDTMASVITTGLAIFNGGGMSLSLTRTDVNLANREIGDGYLFRKNRYPSPI